ncbi:GNAT family N-acetyltransferase [Virgibacillus sp. AGTR]|uniref:GNAT family N-acetyltransferase n=1 Tax=Virgibacillus sp. AGTR TaxID=2812055 RepID=UPI0019630959|nr:GNAT family N-acetyltransferase [Virgibacillus sp. AGTR]MCC2248479.1 GNAT family N-acetyltransferase [Virgibacillus sp. AGTR]QRZ16657.1 GNAT family N-acetyltransferase [Virgibacillus sp. AGTR]
MHYSFKPMTQEQAEIIAYEWHYDGEYRFYNMEEDQEDLQEFLNPERRQGSHFIVHDEKNELVGFFTYHCGDHKVEIGLGMKPELTGLGLGLSFLQAGIQFAEKKYICQRLTLSVASFNQRAIKVYKKAGFQTVESFTQHTNGSNYEFIKMMRSKGK